MAEDELEHLRSVLAHAHEQEKSTPLSFPDPPPANSQVQDQVEQLRSMLAHAHEPDLTPLQKLVWRITGRRAPVKERAGQPGKKKDAA